ncbi:reverse transcriptase domain-containing protein [Tanacetum coccineum]
MQTRSSSKFVGEPSTNPTSTIPKRRNRRRSIQRVEPFSLVETPVVTMADQRTMAELLRAPTEGYAEAIVVPPIPAEHFELKHSLINLVTSKQFFGFEKEDPHAHIRYFNKITSTLKYKDVPETSIKLMLFPFSIDGPARIWLDKEPSRSILTWDDLVSKFINHFFPPSKTTNLRNEISNFQQRFDESFYEAWDRFKDLLRACPHHGFTELHQLDTFYNGLNPSDQDSLNSAAGGNLLERKCSSCGALYNREHCCSNVSSVDNFVRDPNPISYDETPDSSQQPPRNCSKCGGPFGGLHCRQCTCDRCRRKFMVEVCSLCCGEDGKLFDNCPNPTHFKDFYNSLQQPQTHSAESFNDNPNFGYTPQEPFVYNQDPSEIFSQSPPQIDQRYCYGCGDPLDDLFCQRCTCESCGNDAHCGYDCPPQVPFVYDQDMCFNQNFDNNFPQTSPSFLQQFPCCENCGGPHETFQYQPLNQNFYEPNLCYNSNSSGFDQYQPPQYTVIHQPPQETSVQAREELMD